MAEHGDERSSAANTVDSPHTTSPRCCAICPKQNIEKIANIHVASLIEAVVYLNVGANT